MAMAAPQIYPLAVRPAMVVVINKMTTGLNSLLGLDGWGFQFVGYLDPR